MGLSGNTLLTVPIDPDNNLYAFNFSLVGSDIVGPDENGWYTQTCDGYYNARNKLVSYVVFIPSLDILEPMHSYLK